MPDFTLKVMHNGRQVWTTRVVIGKPSMATPLLSETMKSITVNPTWTVPQSIVRNEYLPALAQDPTVLERMGLRVSYERRRRDHHPAAGRRQCAGTRPVQHQQPLFGLPARHAGQELFRARRARLQPRLHAGAGSGEVRRSAPQDRAAERALERGADPADVRRLRAEPAGSADHDLGPPDLSDGLCRRCRQAADAARRLQSRQPHDRRDQAGARPPGTAPERKREEIAGSSPRKPAAPARTGSLPSRSTGRDHGVGLAAQSGCDDRWPCSSRPSSFLESILQAQLRSGSNMAPHHRSRMPPLLRCRHRPRRWKSVRPFRWPWSAPKAT